MRNWKRVIGWLYVACVIVSVWLLASLFDRVATPFLKGGKYYWSQPLQDKHMAKELGRNWGKAPPGQALDTYIRKHKAYSLGERHGLEALANVIENTSSAAKIRSPLDAFPAVIFDPNGRLLGASPPNTSPTGSYLQYAFMSPGWKGYFTKRAALLIPAAGVYRSSAFESIKDPAGRVVAYLAVPDMPSHFYQLPEGMYLPQQDWIVNRSIWSIVLALAAWILLAVWVGMDAAWRGSRPLAWGFLVLLTNPIGLAAYLIGRAPAPGKCPNCSETVLAKFVRCPACG
ncbi:MAG: hypothetical protein WCL39_10090, partial [Armatimonadota bacterium]